MKEQIEQLIKKYNKKKSRYTQVSLMALSYDEKQARADIIQGIIDDLENLLKSEQ